ncbi:MAG TPA: ATP-binding protein [bacterium]|nr:ATP-binding protein [bacterium]
MKDDNEPKTRSNLFNTILKSKMLLQNAIDGIDDCILIVDQDLRILWANLSTILYFTNIRAEDITAKSFQKALGKHCYRFLFDATDPPFRNRALCPLRTLFHTGQPATATISYHNKIYELITYPMQSTGSTQKVAILILRDITESSRSQDQKDEMLAIHHVMIQTLPIGLLMVNPEMRITLANKQIEHLFKIPASKCRGLHLNELLRFPESIRDDMINQLKTHCRTGKPILPAQLASIPAMDGQIVIQMQISRIRASDNNPSLTILINNLTDEMVLKEHIAFNLLSNEIGNITQRVSRELRNPLGIIRGFAEHLLTTVDDPETRKDIEAIHAQAIRTHDCINNLMEFAQPAEIGCQDVDLNTVIERVVKYQEFEALSAKVHLETELETQLPRLYTSEVAMRQVLLNLIQNGIQATPSGGRVITRSRFDAETKTIEISVVDTGEGIDPADQKVIFNPFYSTKPNGSGLGLAIVKDLVEKSRGSIEMMSSKGLGTVVKLRFPLSDAAPQPGEAEGKETR